MGLDLTLTLSLTLTPTPTLALALTLILIPIPNQVSCCLILINAIIGFPDSLVDRVKLRSEFIRLSLLDVLQQLHREKHVDVVRQVGAFELGLGLGLG